MSKTTKFIKWIQCFISLEPHFPSTILFILVHWPWHHYFSIIGVSRWKQFLLVYKPFLVGIRVKFFIQTFCSYFLQLSIRRLSEKWLCLYTVFMLNYNCLLKSPEPVLLFSHSRLKNVSGLCRSQEFIKVHFTGVRHRRPYVWVLCFSDTG